MRDGTILNAGTIHSSIRNDLMRKGIPWGGAMRVNHEGREMSLNLTNHITEGDHKDCITWTFDTSSYESAKRLLASTSSMLFHEDIDAEKIDFKHVDQTTPIFLEVRLVRCSVISCCKLY